MFDHTGALLEEYGKTLPALAALRDSMLPTNEKIVLAMLLSRCKPIAEQGWTCWPSQATLAMDTGLGVSTVARALKRLEEAALVTIEDGLGLTSSTYVVDYAAIMELPPNPKRERIKRKLRRS